MNNEINMEEKLKQELLALIINGQFASGYDLVYAYAKDGIPQDRMKGILMELRNKYNNVESEEIEDFFIGVLDRVVGFCSFGSEFYDSSAPIKDSDLRLLIGQTIQEVSSSINTIVPIKKEKDSGEIAGFAADTAISMSTSLSMKFEEYCLNINNPVEILPGIYKGFDELIGLKVIHVLETKESAEITFDSGVVLLVVLTDEAYTTDPEAMVLYGPDSLCVVWN